MARMEFLRNETDAEIRNLQDQGFIVRQLQNIGRFGNVTVALPPDFAYRTGVDVNDNMALASYIRNNPDDAEVRIFNAGANFEYMVGGRKRRETREEIGALMEGAARPRAEMAREVSDFIKARREAELQNYVDGLDKEQLVALNEGLHDALKESSHAKLVALHPTWKYVDKQELSVIRGMVRERMREMGLL